MERKGFAPGVHVAETPKNPGKTMAEIVSEIAKKRGGEIEELRNSDRTQAEMALEMAERRKRDERNAVCFVTYAKGGQPRLTGFLGSPMDMLPAELAAAFAKVIGQRMKNFEFASMTEQTKAQMRGILYECWHELVMAGGIDRDALDKIEPYVRFNEYMRGVDVGFKVAGTPDENLRDQAGYVYGARSEEGWEWTQGRGRAFRKEAVEYLEECGAEWKKEAWDKNLTGPYFDHDCSDCQFLGSMVIAGQKFDSYVCEGEAGAPGGGSYILRYSSEGPDYFSAPAQVLETLADNSRFTLLAAAVYKIHRGER